MAGPDSPLTRSISLPNLVRGLIALFAFATITVAFATGRIGLAIASLLFLVVAVAFRYWSWRLRRAAELPISSGKPR
ncbi:MAG: hypothetical protein ABIQ41_01840 [Gemmatimonadales bacterium]